MGGFSLREAKAADVPAIAALLADDVIGAAREGAPDDPAYAAAFAGIEAQAGNRILLACDGDAVVGCLQLILIPSLNSRGATRAEIEAVRTASARRGEGIGAALTAEALRIATSEGARIAQLTSNAARTDAHRFWKAQGFEQSHAGFKRKLG